MDDIFIERIVQRKKDTIYYVKILSLILSAFLAAATLVWLLLLIPALSFLTPIALAGCGYGLWRMIGSLHVEYEYIVTNGELDIDMIVHRRRRKRLFSGRVRDFEIMARLDSAAFREAAVQMERGRSARRLQVLDCAAIANTPSSWFFITNYQAARLMVVFDPDERMLAHIKRFNPSRVQYTAALHR